ncbi:MAG: aminopeptidase [Anaerolineae bacterium]|nr:MAG: aminopeptidase [Anaerolineae bacterium]
MPIPDFDQLLERYAELTVRVGLNLRPGQRLIINNPSTRGVPLHAAPLVRKIAASAYKAGARYVDVIWGDESLRLSRFQHAPRDSFAEYSTWHIAAVMEFIRHGDAVLSVRSNDPDLLGGQDPDLVAQEQQTHLQHFQPISQAIRHNAVNWCVVAASGPAWAAKVFPDLSVEQAEERLWQAIFEITRLDRPDPVAAWQEHIRNLLARSRYMNEKQYVALHYKAPGTDLTVGLPQGHRWLSARMTAANGVEFTANLPTEEIFTLPHRERVDGTVRATLPLSYGGTLIEEFTLTFEQGRVVSFAARKGEDQLRKLLETDEGARRLGEVALVPQSSPIARRGHLFFDILIDENASSHLALGGAYRFTLEGGEALTEDEFAARGGNNSLAHVDFMVGSAELDIDGLRADGGREPVMRGGEWAFDV